MGADTMEKIKYTAIGGSSKRQCLFKRLLLLLVPLAFIVFFYKPISFLPELNRIAIEEDDVLATYLKALETNLAGNWSQRYTSEPHLAGTNFGLVKWTEDKLKEYGFKTTIDSYDCYVSYPDDHDLNLLTSDDELIYKAPLKEDELDEDPTTKGDDLIPTFLVYAANGNVTAEYVYANYGTKTDFEDLEKAGVDVKGKIAVIRYGSIFRGLKIKFAQEAGAIAVLLYSDPGDDFGVTPANGYEQYPKGLARHESSVQRGSVQFLSIVPGDPTTPGYASNPGVERQDPYRSTPRIPALPISYREVTPILKALNGHGLAASDLGNDWTGELQGYDYSIGPNPDYKLNLYSNQIFNITPLWNVYGEIEGENKDEVLIIGNHRDAWIKGGAGDPNSGSAVMIEVARGLGELLKTGWKPKRTIVLASWDGEEYGLLGSTEFGENFSAKLQKKVVAYLNLDVAVVGPHFRLSASPILNNILRKTAKQLEYPKGGTLYEHFQEDAKDHIVNLGSGSDYTVFLEHLGISSVDMTFSTGLGDPVYQYHSNYDSFHWMSTYADPGFVYHNLMGKYLGLLTLQLSEREVIEFQLKDYSSDLIKYFNETVDAIPEEWLSKNLTDFNLEDENYAFIHEISQAVYGERWSLFPELLGPMNCHSKVLGHHHSNATLGDLIEKTAADLALFDLKTQDFDLYTEVLQSKYDHKESLSFWERIKLHFQIVAANKKLQYFERNFLNYDGLVDRSWFRHIVFASGRYTGYEGQTFPGLKEAIEDNDFENSVHWIGVILKTIRRASIKL